MNQKDDGGAHPPRPVSDWQTIRVWVVRRVEELPPWARPPVIGGGILFAIVFLRMVFVLPTAFARPQLFRSLGLVLVVVTVAGAIGGLAYSVVRRPFRRFGPLGDYLTGIACVLAYMGFLAIVWPLGTGQRLIRDWSDAAAFGALSVLFGLVIGQFWFRQWDKWKAKAAAANYRT